MEYIQIGTTRKTHGIGGEIKVAIDEQYEELFLETDRVFLDIRGSKQPYFIESIRGGGDMIVHFDEVPTREDAVLLQSRGIFLPANEVPEEIENEAEELGYQSLIGYMLVDQTAGQIGLIEDIIEMPQQVMAFVQYQGREVLIPLNDQFVQSIDDTDKLVHVDLPEGLLTL